MKHPANVKLIDPRCSTCSPGHFRLLWARLMLAHWPGALLTSRTRHVQGRIWGGVPFDHHTGLIIVETSHKRQTNPSTCPYVYPRTYRSLWARLMIAHRPGALLTSRTRHVQGRIWGGVPFNHHTGLIIVETSHTRQTNRYTLQIRPNFLKLFETSRDKIRPKQLFLLPCSCSFCKKNS